MTASCAAMTRTVAMRITDRTAPLLLLLEIFIIDSKMAKGEYPTQEPGAIFCVVHLDIGN